MHIREAQPEDASAVIALFEKLYTETKFLLFEPGEATVHDVAIFPRVDMFRRAHGVAACGATRRHVVDERADLELGRHVDEQRSVGRVDAHA